MKRRKFLIPLIIGVSLIFISFWLIIAQQIRVQTGFNKCQATIEKMDELLPERSAGIPGIYPNPIMPILEIDSVDYVAMLEIPSLDVTLPVADKWNSDKLVDSPARFCGSAYDHTLVIGGADYSHQFSFCDMIDNGTTVTVTDMTGTLFTYTVTCVERAESAESQWLTSKDYDLTLFCRDIYSMDYISVRCDYVYS